MTIVNEIKKRNIL